MKTEVKLADALGSELVAVEFSSVSVGQCVLVFGNGTFTTLGVDLYSEGFCKIAEDELSWDVFGDDNLIRAGVASAVEIKERRAERDRKSEADRKLAQDRYDKSEYERLKQKFGDRSVPAGTDPQE